MFQHFRNLGYTNVTATYVTKIQCYTKIVIVIVPKLVGGRPFVNSYFTLLKHFDIQETF